MRQGEVPDWKKEKVDELADLIKEYSVVGVVDMKNFPSKQLVKVKKGLRETAKIKMSKKSLIQRALKKAGVEELTDKLKGQPALIFTKENPFKLSKFIIKNKTNAPAKPGAEMPKDIVINAGETDFMPGPIVGELQKMGIKAAIEGGKVVIKEDSVIAEEGEEITKEQADLMKKLKIEPMEISLDLLAAYENGVVFGADVLKIDTEQTLSDVKSAYQKAFNLAFNVEYPTEQNIELFVQKAFRGAKALAIEADYTCSATIKDIVSKADSQMKNLKGQLPEEPAEKEEEKSEKEEKKEETEKEAEKEKTEEKKEESKEEKKEEKTEEKKKEKKEKTKKEKKSEEKEKEESGKEETKEKKSEKKESKKEKKSEEKEPEEKKEK
ncbi:MAG: 50S ribosomal protein L10 [Candidatus Undinarchaeales archaeon]